MCVCFVQILTNATKYRMPAHSSVLTVSAHTYANVLRVMSKRLTTERAKSEMVGFLCAVLSWYSVLNYNL